MAAGPQGDFASKVQQILDQIEDFKKGLADVAGAGISWQRLDRWADRVKRFLSSYLPDEIPRFEAAKGPMYMGAEDVNFENAIAAKLEYLAALGETIVDDPSILVGSSPKPAMPLTEDRPARAIPQTRRVFVVHGHDEANLLKLERFLRDKIGLSPIILRYEPGKGRTLIEKFEEVAEGCSFAFVLLTPDDLVRVTDTRGGHMQEYSQPRPNTIFELGWFCGKLGRDRVCILIREGTTLHTDLEGITRIEFTRSVEEKTLEIEAELEAAGLPKRK
jgi:predicted nucleotide-binding protein